MLRSRRHRLWLVAPAALLLGSLTGCGKPAPAAAPSIVEAPPEPLVEAPAVLPLAPVPPIFLRGVGFEAPESIMYDAVADVYLVSNVNGGAADVDGNGFISRVAPDGTLLELKWIDGTASGTVLNAPKGMALIGGKLFVADIDVVRSFDRKSGQALGKIAILSAGFLNDVAAAPDGTLYVSDTGLGKIKGLADPQKNGADAVYAIDARGVATALVKGKELGQPNGLLADAAGVLVAALSGELYRVSPQGQRQLVAKLPGAGLDGLVQTPGGRLIVSSWETSTVYVGRSPPAAPGTFDVLIAELESPADLGYDEKRRQVLVPLFKQNAIYIQQLPRDAN